MPFAGASLGMLQRSVIKELFDGTIGIKVVMVEDLVGLKIQAMANDPSRRSQDLADIEALMELHQTRLNWDLLTEYFQLFDQTDLLQKLKEKYGHTL